MTITFPRTDIMTTVGYQDGSFTLAPVQELSRSASAVFGKDLGPARWIASFTTERLHNPDAVKFEAKLNSLDGVMRNFEACDPRRLAPRAYPNGGANNGLLAAVAADNHHISLTGLLAGQIISEGDYLSFVSDGRRALHQASEDIVANGAGATGSFEVRPHIRKGFTLGVAVNLAAPRGLFVLVPGSVQPRASGTGTVTSFQASEAI